MRAGLGERQERRGDRGATRRQHDRARGPFERGDRLGERQHRRRAVETVPDAVVKQLLPPPIRVHAIEEDRRRVVDGRVHRAGVARRIAAGMGRDRVGPQRVHRMLGVHRRPSRAQLCDCSIERL